jgi:hypothetical protein
MNAGATQHPVGTRIRITKVVGKYGQFMLGLTGELTHAFPGPAAGDPSQYLAGVRVDAEAAAGKLAGSMGDYNINLMVGDEFEVL